MHASANGIQADHSASPSTAVLELVNSPEPPRRLLLGDGDYDAIFEVYRGRMAEWGRLGKCEPSGRLTRGTGTL